MRNDRFERELALILLLTGNQKLTVKEICERLNISQRTFYYYIEFFRDYNFEVLHDGNYFSLSQNSYYFKRLMQNISFTRDEALAMLKVLDTQENQTTLVQSVKSKLLRFFNLDSAMTSEEHEQNSRKISMLHDAITQQLMVVLKNYSSPHSQTQKDRLVEPFLLLNDKQEVRCYEPSSAMNKTFKISRMESVEPLATTWLNEHKHKKMYTDIFMFSSEEQRPVKLLMGMLAHNVMTEEYPRSRKLFTKQPDGRWLLDMKVCSFKGIGRFVLGLYDDIEILESKTFKSYLKEKIKLMAQREQ